MPATPDQLVPYWDPTNQQLLGPANVPSGSNESVSEIQAVAATIAALPMGIVARSGRIIAARVAVITAATGNATYAVDIKRNGVSILTAPITVDSTLAARVSRLGALVANVVVAAGDFFECAITNTPGAGAAPANAIIQVDMVVN